MMHTAIVYDWLVTKAGGERVVEALYSLFPSQLFTLFCDHKQFRSYNAKTSFIQHFPKVFSWYRHFLPFFPIAIEQFDLSSYKVVLSISHAVAKGVLTTPDQIHLCYCFTPMRYAWDLTYSYLNSLSVWKRPFARYFLHHLRQWDIVSSCRVDQFIAISHFIAKRIEKTYRRRADVIYPPVATHLFHPNKKRESYFLTVSRLVPYKRIDLIIEAFTHLRDEKLLVIGDGPEKKNLRRKASSNVEFLGWQSDLSVQDYMGRAKAFIFAAEEDFGITPVEAQAAGTPVIAYGKGGALETVIANQTGIFFAEQTIASLIEAIQQFEKSRDLFHPEIITSHAKKFSEERFKNEFKHYVEKQLSYFHHRPTKRFNP